MQLERCRSCGGELERIGNSYVCKFCGSKWVIDADQDVHVIDRANAWSALRDCDFEHATELFENIIFKEPQNHEAYWGRALANAGIMYVTDFHENKKVPTCNSISESSFIDSRDVKRAIELAPADIAESYRAQAEQIEAIRVEWVKKASREPAYDVFISYKDSDREHHIERTEDSYDAHELYMALTEAGYKVFFSRVSLRNKVSEHYEPYIYNAIKTAKVMIVYGEKPEYFNAVWIKNEWMRFRKRIELGEKHQNSLVVAYKGLDPADLPIGLRSRQCIDASSITFLEDLKKHIDKIIRKPEKAASAVKVDEPAATVEVPERKKSKKGIIIAAIAVVLAVCIGVGFIVTNLADGGGETTPVIPHETEFVPLPTDEETVRPVESNVPKETDSTSSENTSNKETESSLPYDGLEYTSNGEMCIVVGIGSLNGQSEIVIPSEYNGVPVRKIADYAFEGAQFASITIPDGVHTIGSCAFINCSVKDVYIPQSVTSIGNSAFDRCNYIDNIFFGGSETEWNRLLSFNDIALHNGAMVHFAISDESIAITEEPTEEQPTEGYSEEHTESPTESHTESTTESSTKNDYGLEYTLNEDGNSYSVTGIGSYVDKNIIISSTYNGLPVTAIGEYSFSNQDILSVQIPEGLTQIGKYAFENCSSLKKVTMPNSVTHIEEHAFANCHMLENFQLSNNINTIGKYAFYGCYNLTEIYIPQSTKIIEEYAFAEVHAWELDKSATRIIYLGTFEEWSSVTKGYRWNYFDSMESSEDSFIFAEVNGFKTAESEFKYLLNDDGNSYSISGNNTYDAEVIIIPSEYNGLPITKITYGAFYWCESLTSVIIPDTVTSIDDSAFSYCSSLTTVTYSGSAEDWANISIGNGNSYLINSTIIYEKVSETETETVTETETETETEEITETETETETMTETETETVTETETETVTETETETENNFELEKSRIDQEAAQIVFEDVHGIGTVYLPSMGYTYQDVSISWFAQTPTMVHINGEDAQIIPGANDYAILVATFTCGSTSEMREYSIRVTAHEFSGNCDSNCNICGETRQAGEHVYENECDTDCNVCGAIREVDHLYDNACDVDCNLCGVERAIDGHRYKFDCDADCDICGEVRPGVGHIDMIDAAVEPTCTSTGLTEGKHCEICAKVLVEQITVSALGHNEVSHEAKEPTCNEVGWDAYVTCSRCDHTTYVEKPATSNHDYNDENTCTVCGDYADKGMVFTQKGDCYSVTGYTKNTSLVVIPSTYKGLPVTSIGQDAFAYCSSLTEIVIPESVTSIEQYAFKSCTSLTSINIPDSVTSIGAGAFTYCTSLASIVIPSSVTSIAYNVFRQCTSLTSVEIPDSVTDISAGAFQDSKNIANVIIPAIAINLIPHNNLETVVITSGESIGDLAFYNCAKLKSVVIPDGVSSIGDQAFFNCSNLSSLVIPYSVTSIGNTAFHGCSSLATVNFTGSEEDWSKISIGSNNSPLTEATIIFEKVSETGTDIPTEVPSDENTISPTEEPTVAPTEEPTTAPTEETTVAPTEEPTVAPTEEPTVAPTEEPTEEETENDYGLEYTLNEDESSYSVTGIGECKATDIVIPKKYKGLPVTSIGKDAFEGCRSLTSVEIGDSVTSIGEDAFYNCKSLTSVEIGDSVTSIGEYAFRGCTSLTSVEIGDSVTSIGNYAFYRCTSITSMEIGDSVTSIGEDAFSSCTSLAYNEYDNGLYLGNTSNPYVVLVKAKNTSITTCKIHEATKVIYYRAFEYCANLTSVEIGDSVTSIGEDAFYSCTRLTSVYITDIAKWCAIDFGSSDANPLYYAHNLYLNGELITDLVIPDGVESIGDYAFQDCTNLTSVVIPDSVTSIGSSAFYNCDSLTSVYITDIAKWCAIDFGDYDANPLSYAQNLYLNGELVTELVIPDSVTRIGDRAFMNCTSLTSVVIPDSVTSIGEYVFRGCTSLTSVEIPESVTSIGDSAFHICDSLAYNEYDNGLYLGNTSNPYVVLVKAKNETITSCEINESTKFICFFAFEDCKSLTSVVIPDSVTSIGDEAFRWCSSLTSIVIPDSVTRIGGSAFGSCDSLTSITVDENNAYYKSVDGNLYSKDGKTLIQYAIGKPETSFVIPEGVTSIGGGAFRSCTSLTSVVIPESVTSIGLYAFYDCDSLTSVVIPDSVTSIGLYAFYNCTSLTSVTFKNPNGWWYASYSGATSGTSISSSSLANASTAAEYLRSTYDDYYWKRS